MSNTVFVIGILVLADTQREITWWTMFLLVVLGILADIFAYMETVQRK